MNYAAYLIKSALAKTVETMREEKKRCPSDSALTIDDPKCASGYTRKGFHRGVTIKKRKHGHLGTLGKSTSNPTSGKGGSASTGGDVGGSGPGGSAGGNGGGM